MLAGGTERKLGIGEKGRNKKGRVGYKIRKLGGNDGVVNFELKHRQLLGHLKIIESRQVNLGGVPGT